ncbi:MAG: PilZ domain-containing protein [Candidatus Omnitrophica bacterium]|nr:PilZ domain-containing protein [Candidatus Omnitrophota bacterium]
MSARSTIPDALVNFKLLDPRTWSTHHEKTLVPLRNIGMGGICIQTRAEIPNKAPVGIDIRLPHHDQTIRIFGRIAWIKKEDKPSEYTLGISFSWWQREEDKATINALIKKGGNAPQELQSK